MSIEALQWAWKVEGLKMAPKFVLISLADYADESGSCFPGQEKIAERTSCSVDTVARSIRVLEDAGLLRREKRRKEGGYRTSDRFYLAVGSLPRNLPGSGLPRNEGDSHPANDPILTPQFAGVSPSNNPQSEPSDIKANAEEDFEAWWKLYPRKASKGSARKAYRTARKKVSAEILSDGVSRFAAQVRANGTEQQFIAHASTWLNGERWLDEPEQPRNAAQSAASRALAVDLGCNTTRPEIVPQIAVERPSAIGPSILGEMNQGRW